MWSLILPLLLAANPCTLNLAEPIPAEYIPPPYFQYIPGGAQRLDIWGPVLNKWDVVIIGDGFTDTPEDRALFVSKADEVINYIAAWTPYRRCAFNFQKVFVISAQRGVDYPLKEPDPVCWNTALNLGFGYIFDDGGTFPESWLYTYTPERCKKAVEQIFDEDFYDLIITLANDEETRGGAAWVGPGYPPLVTVSIGPGMHEVAPHEVGHQVAFLHDEYDDGIDTLDSAYPVQYEDGKPKDLEEPNVTVITDPNEIKWKEFIQPGTPLNPTTWDALSGPDEVREKVVGLWEGAAYYDRDVYRPQHNCLMREADIPFCKVCEYWVRQAMAFRCKWDHYVLVERLNFGSMSHLACRERYSVFIQLPPCLPCLRPDIDDTEWVDPGIDTIRVEIGPLPSGTTMFVLDDLGQTVASGVPAFPDTLTLRATFEAEPFANYFIDIKPASCPDDVLPVEARLFINGLPAAFP